MSTTTSTGKTFKERSHGFAGQGEPVKGKTYGVGGVCQSLSSLENLNCTDFIKSDSESSTSNHFLSASTSVGKIFNERSHGFAGQGEPGAERAISPVQVVALEI